jgi:ribonuclease G
VGVITDLVKEGQEVTVQVIKDPLGSKGARLTTHITLPSRYLVLMPTARNVGISQKIEGEQARQRLKDLVVSMAGDMAGGGYIIRTAAEEANDEALRADMDYLHKLWDSVREQTVDAAPGSVIYEDLPLILRALRDLVDLDVEKVRIDSRENYKKALDFAEQFVPQVAPRIEYYPGERPIFDLYGVEDEIQKALERKVLLKSGGYLIIDQTEAMTTIDVNTGAYVGHRNL